MSLRIIFIRFLKGKKIQRVTIIKMTQTH